MSWIVHSFKRITAKYIFAYSLSLKWQLIIQYSHHSFLIMRGRMYHQIQDWCGRWNTWCWLRNYVKQLIFPPCWNVTLKHTIKINRFPYINMYIYIYRIWCEKWICWYIDDKQRTFTFHYWIREVKYSHYQNVPSFVSHMGLIYFLSIITNVHHLWVCSTVKLYDKISNIIPVETHECCMLNVSISKTSSW